MLKADGSVMVHADTGGYKPQNCAILRPPELIGSLALPIGACLLPPLR